MKILNILWLSILATTVQAQYDTCTNFGHFDLIIKVTPPASQGGKILIDPDLNFPLNVETGSTVVPADFRDFAGGPHKTDDPGWVINSGGFSAGENLWFRALGTLRYWNPTIKQWSLPPAGERVRYYGAIPGDLFLEGNEDKLEEHKQGTIWAANSLTGPIDSPIDQADSNGGIHTHLDFCLEAADGDCSIPGVGHTGNPAVGGYLIELQLFSDANSAGKYTPSRPIQVMLNNGLDASECGAAISALIAPAAVDSSAAQPGAGVLIMSGY